MTKRLIHIFLLIVFFLPFGSMAQELEMPTDSIVQQEQGENSSTSINAQAPTVEYLKGEAVEIKTVEEDHQGNRVTVTNIVVKISSKEKKGQLIEIPWDNDENRPGAFVIKKGDKLVISQTTASTGETWAIIDRNRSGFLLFLFVLFLITAFLVAGKQGIKAVGVMAITFIVILYFLIPKILSGADPLMVAIFSISVFFAPALLISHGVNKKTFSAILGIIFSTIVIGILALLSVKFSGVTGATEETTFLGTAGGQNIDLLKIFLAGILFGGLGVIDDLAITQASIVKEIKTARPNLRFKELFLSAMNVGKDHISAAINTLFLAYTGAALPLIILLAQLDTPLWVAIQREFITTEIIRTLVSTIGLIIAVPIATTFAAYIFEKSKN